MEKFKVYSTSFMEKLEFPEDAQRYLGQISEALERDGELYNEMNVIIKQFFDRDHTPFEEISERLNHLAHKADIHHYTIHFMFFMYSSQILKSSYQKAGISEEVFWNSMLDLRCKLIECYNIHGIWGTFVSNWFPGFYKMQRFGLGRLQYEYEVFQHENYQRKGFTVHKGDRVYNLHIPSYGSFTRNERMASYRKAYEFFKDELDGNPIVFVCDSWLLYPKNKIFMPKGSNIVDFMHDFDIIASKESDTFSNAWRVFGKEHENPVEKLPANTSLQRAYINWLKDGNKTGTGFGIILFDGENII